MSATGRKPWRASELNLVKGASKQRQAEDKLRADAWQKNREAELEAVVNRTYDGMDIPEIRAVVEAASKAMAPFIAEFDRLFAEHYPAEFARAKLGITITPGGIPEDMRKQVRRDAAQHIAARKAFMVANSSTFVTETMTEATKRTTDNPEVHEILDRLAVPNRATPTLEPPGPSPATTAAHRRCCRTRDPSPRHWRHRRKSQKNERGSAARRHDRAAAAGAEPGQ